MGECIEYIICSTHFTDTSPNLCNTKDLAMHPTRLNLDLSETLILPGPSRLAWRNLSIRGPPLIRTQLYRSLRAWVYLLPCVLRFMLADISVRNDKTWAFDWSNPLLYARFRLYKILLLSPRFVASAMMLDMDVLKLWSLITFRHRIKLSNFNWEFFARSFVNLVFSILKLEYRSFVFVWGRDKLFLYSIPRKPLSLESFLHSKHTLLEVTRRHRVDLIDWSWYWSK